MNKWCGALKARLPFERTFAGQINRMKHALLPLLMLATTAGAQLPYDLTVLDQPYTPLTEATVLDMDQFDIDYGDFPGWDDPSFSVQLGFEFSFSGYTVDALDQVDLGALMAGTYIDDKSGLPLLQAFIPTGLDLTDRGLLGLDPSIIRWNTSGAPGSQVFTIEWANAGIYEEISDSTSTSFVNIQVRLFEANGVVEFHYGPSLVDEAGDFGPNITGLILALDPFSYAGNIYALNGDPADPSIVPYDSVDEWYYGATLLGHPADGTVYRWGPTGTTLDVTEARATALQAWPNPTAGEVNLAFSGAHTWTVLDATGRVVLHGAGQDGDRLDLSGLNAGAYTVRLDNGAAQRVVKH